MSDPVTNVEIEDVLSSIRRLVSENGRVPVSGAAHANKPVADVEPEVKKPDLNANLRQNKLVLTESLRIAEQPERQTFSVHDAVSDDIQIEESSSAGSADYEEPESVLPGFHHREAEAIEITPLEPQSEDTPLREERSIDLSFESRRLSFEAISDELHFDLVDRSETIGAEAEDRVLKVVKPWDIEGETLSEWRSEAPQDPAPYEPDTPGDSDYAGTEVAALEWDDQSAQVDDVDNVEVEIVTTVAQDSEESVTPENAEASEENPDSRVTQVFDIKPEIEDLPQEAVLDEQMLRDLVGEIVRQELQGPLGERITRNVRKLVRREINRAMVARNINGDY
ncbi:MAG: hypothetical protein ACRBBQ_11905 [Cognatishimia sp.]